MFVIKSKKRTYKKKDFRKIMYRVKYVNIFIYSFKLYVFKCFFLCSGSHHPRSGSSAYSSDPSAQQGSASGQHPPPPPVPVVPPPPPPPNGGAGGPNGVLYPNAPYTDHGFLQMTLGYLSPSSGTYKSVDPYFLSQGMYRIQKIKLNHESLRNSIVKTLFIKKKVVSSS